MLITSVFGGWIFTGRGHEGTFWSTINILNLVGGYTCLYICKHLSSCSIKIYILYYMSIIPQKDKKSNFLYEVILVHEKDWTGSGCLLF